MSVTKSDSECTASEIMAAEWPTRPATAFMPTSRRFTTLPVRVTRAISSSRFIPQRYANPRKSVRRRTIIAALHVRVHASQQEVHAEVGDEDTDERKNRVSVEEVGVPEGLQRTAVQGEGIY